jgi:hypothetical protein
MREISARTVSISMREISRRKFDMRETSARRISVRVTSKCERIVLRFCFSFNRSRLAKSNRIRFSVDT